MARQQKHKALTQPPPPFPTLIIPDQISNKKPRPAQIGAPEGELLDLLYNCRSHVEALTAPTQQVP